MRIYCNGEGMPGMPQERNGRKKEMNGRIVHYMFDGSCWWRAWRLGDGGKKFQMILMTGK